MYEKLRHGDGSKGSYQEWKNKVGRFHDAFLAWVNGGGSDEEVGEAFFDWHDYARYHYLPEAKKLAPVFARYGANIDAESLYCRCQGFMAIRAMEILKEWDLPTVRSLAPFRKAAYDKAFVLSGPAWVNSHDHYVEVDSPPVVTSHFIPG